MSEPKIDLLFFRSPQQPPGSKELEGGSMRLSMRGPEGALTASARLHEGGVLVTKGRASCWYPGSVVLRARYELAEEGFDEALTRPDSPQGKARAK